MAGAPLAVVIPVRHEADGLPLLLADLASAAPGLLAEVVVADAGSSDGTAAVARLAGATVVQAPPGRGRQLLAGVAATTAPWLLMLHGDSRLPAGWVDAVGMALSQPATAWSFGLGVHGGGPGLRILEGLVALRSGIGQCPYGDQGLLLPRSLYRQAGGYRPLALMEDLDLVLRLRRLTHLRGLGLRLQVSGRGWRRHGVVGTSWRNWQLRRAWRRGADPDQLAQVYGRRTP